MARFFLRRRATTRAGAGNVRAGQHEGGIGFFGQLLGRFFCFVARCGFCFSFFFRKNKAGKIPLWVSVQSYVWLFYMFLDFTVNPMSSVSELSVDRFLGELFFNFTVWSLCSTNH